MNNTLEKLENNYWGDAPNESTYLVKRIHELRRKNIKEFNIEDLRILISQDESLDIVVPIAIDKLKENFFSEGDYYPGDLINSILMSDKGFWNKEQDLKKIIINLYELNINNVANEDITQKILDRISESFESFK